MACASFAAQQDTIDLLDTEAEKLMNFVTFFNTITKEPNKFDTNLTIERGAPVICHMTECASRLKSFANRYSQIQNKYETYMEVESVLWEGLRCLKRERRNLMKYLRSQRYADLLEDAWLTGDPDMFMDMLWYRHSLLGASFSYERVISAYHMGVANVIRGKYGFARELWAIEHDSKVLMEEMNNIQMVFMSTMSILGPGR
ncbi:hypothetical protein VPNG_02735 [Cytospora leucostoma]|uniref:Uncharacterized protein n=1 Tax=Cytospora leucostoma TaxID=1230097 RepID=A0A423XJD0_9PEZI|nr:hypothetical protein VPNG_02735 [Cytospora leucostoma]